MMFDRRRRGSRPAHSPHRPRTARNADCRPKPKPRSASARSLKPGTSSAKDDVSTACAIGISRQSSRGAPMSTVTRPSSAVRHSSGPPVVSIFTSSISGFGHQQIGDAARGIAARFHFAAVGVEDAHEGVGALRRLHHDHLIAADPPPPVGDGSRARFIERERERPRVEDREIVAQPMHFEERGHRRLIGPPQKGCQRWRSAPVLVGGVDLGPYGRKMAGAERFAGQSDAGRFADCGDGRIGHRAWRRHGESSARTWLTIPMSGSRTSRARSSSNGSSSATTSR